MSEDKKRIINHYKSVGRHGKQLVEEDVKAGSDTARFLERMEQRRLATPCYIAIDMRGKVEDSCRAYTFEGLTHHLDQKCINLFEQEAARYDGQYTVGVFEAVQGAEHTFRAQHEREQEKRIAEQKRQLAQAKSNAPKDPLFNKSTQNDSSDTVNESVQEAANEETDEHSIRLIPFGYRAQRKEGRLNYVTEVSIRFDNGTVLKGKTADISTAGIKVSLFGQTENIATETVLGVSFDALEAQYTLQLGFVDYTLIEQTQDHHGRTQFRLARTDQSEHEQFNIFIDEFIKSYQSRYKLELEDSLLALYAKAYERIFNAGSACSISLLGSLNNKLQSLYTATRPEEHSQLHNALIGSIAEHIPQLCEPSEDGKIANNYLLEAFLVKGKQQHRVYCSTRSALIKNKQFDEFLKVGSQCHLIARLQLHTRAISPDDRDAALQLLEPLNEEAPLRYQAIAEHWKKISHIAYYQVVEEKLSLDSPITGQSAQLTALSEYQLPPGAQRIWQLAYRNERKEPRYLYKTQASITAGKTQVNGETLDFSPAGMRIKLHNVSHIPMDLDINQTIKVDLPDMQKLAKKTAKLQNLPYRVTQWHPHDHSISVRRDYSVKSHDGESFFSRLIASNESKLKQCPEDLETTLVASMVEAMVSAYLSGIPLFIRRFPGGRYAIDSAAATENANALLWQFKTQDTFDFSALNLEEFFGQTLKGQLNRRSQLTSPINARLFATFPEQPGEELVIRDEVSMTDNREIAKFILMTRKSKRHRILRAQFLPPPFIKLEEFKEELSVIRSNSSNRARQFEQNIQQLVALVDIEDISAFYQS
ncbi:PilZ domain-containing protein [Pleionea litopenaei]|uniref:PilZ domain-containing protein n=1 Tax=Pleionea litopenaei TaxID=3070815 RepID=A0AA51RS69_9GAMM|nr:PilZ domain-containing protein [Pleionea sp. HL-JVS1]WMS86646.1 PilZ domain-containing protein [Pleionea sp. HL-JVS1]